MGSLLNRQIAFTKLVPRLIDFCFSRQYDVVIAECWRPRETAQIYAAQGRGSKNSLHTDKLAIDLILVVNGNPLKNTDSYLEAGLYWENLGTEDFETHWGGRWGDGGHFSMSAGDDRK
jgi:hypothetical protein